MRNYHGGAMKLVIIGGGKVHLKIKRYDCIILHLILFQL
jgi:hypothetical protein